MRSRTWASLSLRGPLCLPFVCARRLLAVCVPPCQWVFEGSGWVGWGGGRDRVTESERVRGRVILIRMEAGRGRSFSCFFFFWLVSYLPFLPFRWVFVFFSLPFLSPSSSCPTYSSFSFLCFLFCFVSSFYLEISPLFLHVLYPPFFLSYFCFSLPLSHPAL